MIALLFTSLLAMAAPAKSTAPAPSSKIPEKREFPLNTAVSPCQDFHKYVCSKAEEAFALRPDRSMHYFAFSDSQERLLEKTKAFMRDLPKKKNLDARTEQIRDVYLSCMNGPERARDEKKFVTGLVKELEAVKSAGDLLSYSHKNASRGLSELVGVWPANNPDNPKQIDAVIAGRYMLLPDHKYYDQPEVLKELEKVLTVFYQSVYPGIKKREAVKKAQALIELQKDFIKVYPVRNVQRQRWSENRTSAQEEVLKKFANLKLEELFAQLPAKIPVKVPVPETFEFLNADLSTRPLQVWKDLYLYQAASDLMDDAYQKYYKAQFSFQKKFFGGPEKRSDRQERCTSLVSDTFTKELDAALVDQIFPNFDESKVQEVGTRIRQSILEGLEKNQWLSRAGKKEAIAKIRKARLQLVKPHNDREWDFWPQKKYSPNHFVQNMITLAEARWQKNLQEMSEPANQDAWGMGPLTVNAYYSPTENKFVLPIGILQFPFFDKDGSIIENLGAVGAVIGHELGHSIDDSGSKFDSDGRLKQWMSIKELAEFSTRGQKMIDQFDKIGHDGKLTLGENVADLVGLTFAYNAAFPKGEGSVEDKQKFFVAYARLWCGKIRPDFAKMRLKTDPHAAGWARINEQVKHQPAFAETFQCKAGDPMTLPEKDRVQIW